MSWTDGDGLVWTGDWAFDFNKMIAYRGADVRNHNLRMKDIGVQMKLIDGRMCAYFPWAKTWKDFSDSKFMMESLHKAYHKWLNDEIEKIVL